ncbi:MAG: DUF547 domain-containing protein [Hyphomicrobiaceae bacterium]
MDVARTGLIAALAFGAALASTQVAYAGLKETFAQHTAGSPAKVDHSAWDKLLKKYVKSDASGLNRVDYRAFKANDRETLRGYVKTLEATNVAKLDKAEQFAFWTNLYNAKTIEVVLDHYPVTSIRKITIKEGLFGFLKESVGAGGPWKAKIMQVAGQKLSLDDVEHGILRPVFRDPRVHYAVNCASVGCPNLRKQAFTGANLEAQLEQAAKDYINTPRGIAVSGGKVRASSIYKWFQADFGGNQRSALRHVAKYADAKLKAKLTGVAGIDEFAYDWSLNDSR